MGPAGLEQTHLDGFPLQPLAQIPEYVLKISRSTLKSLHSIWQVRHNHFPQFPDIICRPNLQKSSSWRPLNNWPDIRVHGFFLDMASKQISDCRLSLILAHHLIALTASSECGVFESARAHSRAHWWLRNAQRRGLVPAEPMCAEVKHCTAPASHICTSFAVPKATKSIRPPVWHLITWTKRLKGWKVLLATVLTSSLCESPVRRSSPGQLRVNVWTPAEDSGGSTCSVRESSKTSSYLRPPHTHWFNISPDSCLLRLSLASGLLPSLTHSLTSAHLRSLKKTSSPHPHPPLAAVPLHHPEVKTPNSSPLYFIYSFIYF